MTVLVNGEPVPIGDGATLSDLIEAEAGLAVAVNSTVVSRSAYRSTRLSDGDAVEIVTAVQGG